MNYNGIIGDLKNLASYGIVTPNGFDRSQYEFVCLNCENDRELKKIIKSYDNLSRAEATIGNFWDIAGDVITTIFGAVTGGKSQPVCPPCPPMRQKGLQDYLLPAIVGFGFGYLILR